MVDFRGTVMFMDLGHLIPASSLIRTDVCTSHN